MVKFIKSLWSSSTRPLDNYNALHAYMHEVGVIGDGHELRVAWSSQDGVESPREPHYVEGEGLSPVIGPESDRQIDLPQWHGLPTRHDAMERCSDGAEVCSVNAHLIERHGVHDVEAAASIHQHLGEPLCADDRVDHERISSR